MKTVILAAGRGTRMQRAAQDAALTQAQQEAAERGLKGMIPIHGRPFLDFVISAVADAGVSDVCLVIAPGDNPIRTHYERLPTTRIQLRFAVQQAPRGGADALLAAEEFARGDAVLVLNSDNYYPAAALRLLCAASGNALVGFTRESLIGRGQIPRDRLAGYAIVRTDRHGWLSEIIEKPGTAEMERTEGETNNWISMTCWRFGPSIFRACRAIPPSPRNEYELPDAVQYVLHELHEPFRVLPSSEPVLDLTSRDDIARVEHALHHCEVRL